MDSIERILSANGTASPTPPPPPPNTFGAFAIANVVLMFIIMVGVGISLDLEAARRIFQKKTALIAGTINQYVVVPLLLWGFARMDIYLPLQFRAALVVVGTCPGGVVSNVLSMWLHTDPNLSITITSWTVLLSLGAMPLNLYIYLELAGLGPPPPDTNPHTTFLFATDWFGLGISFAAVIGGNLSGIILQRCFKRRSSRKRIEFICLLHGIPQGALALADNSISGTPVWKMPAAVYGLLIAPTFVAFFWALLTSRYILKLPKPSSAAVAIEASVQNTNIALGVISLAVADPNLRGQALGVPLAHATITIIQCVLLGLLLWRCGWTELDPHGRNPCSIWCAEYYQEAFQRRIRTNSTPSPEQSISRVTDSLTDSSVVPPMVKNASGHIVFAELVGNDAIVPKENIDIELGTQPSTGPATFVDSSTSSIAPQTTPEQIILAEVVSNIRYVDAELGK